MLDHSEIFLTQLKAMIRASHKLTNLSIMLPMITHVAEIDEASLLIKKAFQEIFEEGLDVRMPKIGAMIEVPSAVYQVQIIADRVDFLSVGSNDLTQYILAVDRNNSQVAELYDCLHPAVLKALIETVDGAHKSGKTISICGEMASDPAAVILLLGMGFDALSISSFNLLRVKWIIRQFTVSQARKLLTTVLQMENAIQIRDYLKAALIDAGLGSLLQPGRK